MLCSKTALKRCTSTEHLWKRKLASMTSPELWEIFLPRSERSWRADVLYKPKVSIAMGSNNYRLSMLEYFSSLRVAAGSAAEPASRAAPATNESANVQLITTSPGVCSASTECSYASVTIKLRYDYSTLWPAVQTLRLK